MEGEEKPSSQKPELSEVLKEMKGNMDGLGEKLLLLLGKVREGEYPTKDGISYLEVKHMLLTSYCQHLVFVILMKAEGKALRGHPVLERVAEIRLFLEKIRPIDKKLNYQIQKLLKQADSTQNTVVDKDDLKYKPNPDMLVSKIDEDAQEHGGVYKPPKIAPTSMQGDESARDRRSRLRFEKKTQERASRSTFIRDLQNDIEGRPEEIHETVGGDSKELRREIERLEDRERQEEELFSRVPLSREERKRLKFLKRSRNGLRGITDDFNDDIGGLLGMEGDGESRRQRQPKERSNKALRVKKSKGKFKRKARR